MLFTLPHLDVYLTPFNVNINVLQIKRCDVQRRPEMVGQEVLPGRDHPVLAALLLQNLLWQTTQTKVKTRTCVSILRKCT